MNKDKESVKEKKRGGRREKWVACRRPHFDPQHHTVPKISLGSSL